MRVRPQHPLGPSLRLLPRTVPSIRTCGGVRAESALLGGLVRHSRADVWPLPPIARFRFSVSIKL